LYFLPLWQGQGALGDIFIKSSFFLVYYSVSIEAVCYGKLYKERILMSYYVWLIFGVIAFVIEMMIPTFFAMFAGVGFLAAAAVSFFLPESLFWQLIIASVFMIIGAVVFKKRGMGDEPQDSVGTHNEFVGIKGIALNMITPHQEGSVELYEPVVGERHWPAVSADGEIEENEEIRIVKLSGNTLIVEKI
jgi:inner membrane protein